MGPVLLQLAVFLKYPSLHPGILCRNLLFTIPYDAIIFCTFDKSCAIQFSCISHVVTLSKFLSIQIKLGGFCPVMSLEYKIVNLSSGLITFPSFVPLIFSQTYLLNLVKRYLAGSGETWDYVQLHI